MNRPKLISTGVGLAMLAALVSPALSTPIQSSQQDAANEFPRYSPELDLLRRQLAASGRVDVGIARAEYITTSAGFNPVTSQTIVANDRKPDTWWPQFVENDPRREGRSSITYVVDQSDGSALTWLPGLAVLPNSTTEAVIDLSMGEWQLDPGCNGPAIVKVADSGDNIDVADDIGFGRPRGNSIADVTHGGWINSRFFDIIAPGGSAYVLGVTISFVFLDQNGDPTDIDDNGRADTAFMEIYYNRGFAWAQPGNDDNADIESIVKHEAGHALGLSHFGKVFLTKNGSEIEDIHYAPRAVMNAVYVSPFPDLTGTDKAAFCRIWANSH
ncbi:MAG TPA: hypothetical protein VF251_15015 [Pyrinomonadaceae bacterium]